MQFHSSSVDDSLSSLEDSWTCFSLSSAILVENGFTSTPLVTSATTVST
ncbi:unnamed protein product, partial [Rotaria sp. Silwood1]